MTDAISSLIGIGFTQNEALTKLDQLIKMYGADRAFASVEEMENDFYLNDVQESIFLGNDKRYHCFLNTSNGKRKHLVAKERKNLENKIVKLIKDKSNISQTFTCCMSDIVSKFLDYKEKETCAGTAHKLKWAYNRYIKDSNLETLDISEISVMQLKEFCLEQIDKYNLTSKGYKELKSLLNGLFDYAVDTGLLKNNTAKQMSRINTKKLNRTVSTPDTQVFTAQEESSLFIRAMEMFVKTGNTSYLAIILSGCLGLRAGELIALKQSDFDFVNNEVNIQRQEVVNWVKNENNDLVREGYQVVDYLKTTESRRSLPITDSVARVYDLIVSRNNFDGIDSDYLFVYKDGSRKHASTVATALRRINKQLGFTQRSNHKLRKTLLSELENTIGLTKTRAFAGHSRNSTTLEKNYLYITSPLTSDMEAINSVVTERVPTLLKK